MTDYVKLTSPCGLDCFNCPIHEENITDQIRNHLADQLGVEPDIIDCKGCREQPGCSIPHEDCATLKCVQQKSLDFCHECGEFPCALLQPCADGAERFPHNFKLYNLCRINKVGLHVWAKDEAAEIRRRYFTGKFIIGRGPVPKESRS